MDLRPAVEPPSRSTRPGLSACALCAGETLGAEDPLAGGQPERLRRLGRDGTARLALVECLDACERGDVVVARPSATGRAHGGRPVWFERLAGDSATGELGRWLVAGDGRRRIVATAVLSGVLLAGCGTPGSGVGGADAEGPGSAPGTVTAPPVGAAPSTPSPSPQESRPTATATPSPEPMEPTKPTEPTEPAVELSPDGGVAHLMAGPSGTPEALPALVTLLGEPDTVADGTCNLDFATTASWGDLNVDLNGGTLWGWSIVGAGYPDRVTTPYGIVPGEPVSDAVAATGVQPVPDETFGVVRVQQGRMQWWAPPEHGPDARIDVVAYNPITCG